MKNFEENKLSVKSVIYGALITLALIFVIFCVYTIAVMIKFVVVVLGPVIFSIVTAGVILAIMLGVIKLVKSKKMKSKGEHDDT